MPLRKDLVSPLAPYYGHKAEAAQIIWAVIGDVSNTAYPFAGFMGELFNRPHYDWTNSRFVKRPYRTETVSDTWPLIPNLHRAIKNKPLEVARYCNLPLSSIDLWSRARFLAIHAPSLEKVLLSHPEANDPQLAGYYLYCLSGSVSPRLVGVEDLGNTRPHLSNSGQGIFRTSHQTPNAKHEHIETFLQAISQRLSRVRILFGDWSDCVDSSICESNASANSLTGVTAVILDPPYHSALRMDDLYGSDNRDSSVQSMTWAIANGENERLRIIYCGLDDLEQEFPPNWTRYRWASNGRSRNVGREMIFASPHCLHYQ